MCNQTVCLVAAELEQAGIRTVCLQLLRFVAEKVRPPRALCLPFKHGYPLNRPNDADAQHRVLNAALGILHHTTVESPLVVDYTAGA